MTDTDRTHRRFSESLCRRARDRRAPIDVETTSDDGPRLNLSGEEAELLVRHRGEPLKALQHVVDMAFGRSLDRRASACSWTRSAYRKGKDIELRQMAKYLAEKAEETGRRSATRAAQSVRTPDRPPGGRRSAGREHREHRRRVLEDRPHFRAEVVAVARRPRTSSHPTSSRLRRRRDGVSGLDAIVAIATPLGRVTHRRRSAELPTRGRVDQPCAGWFATRTRTLLTSIRSAGRSRRAGVSRDRSRRRHLLPRARFLHRRRRRGDQRAWKPRRA